MRGDGVPPLLRPNPWGFWASVGLSAVIFGVFVMVQTMVTIAFAVANQVPLQNLKELESNGSVLYLATLTATPLAGGLTVWLASLRKPMRVGEYLALKLPSGRAVVVSLLALAVYLVGCDSVSVWLGRPIVPEVMVEAYRTAGNKPLFWVALVLAAPLFEEIFFRGFLFTGLQHSRVGGVGAIALTSVLWAVIHLQYDWLGMLYILVGGLVLGAVRLRTGSVSLCIFLHALMNFGATLETIWLLQYR